MSDDDQPADDEIDDVEPDPDLEDTMRLGLQEIANDAPRGENVWDTTTSMIAIEVDHNTDEHTVPVPLPPAVIPPTSQIDASSGPPPALRSKLARGIVIGLLAALVLVAIVIALVLAARG